MGDVTVLGMLRKEWAERTFADRFWSRVGPGPGCREWTKAVTSDGYGVVKRDFLGLKAHRVAWELTNGPIPEGLCVLHTCDNPPCCEISHLFLGTRAENNRDRMLKGRNREPMRGEEQPVSKLTEKDVLEIRRRYTPGSYGGVIALAREFGVARTHIHVIINRKAWKHI